MTCSFTPYENHSQQHSPEELILRSWSGIRTAAILISLRCSPVVVAFMAVVGVSRVTRHVGRVLASVKVQLCRRAMSLALTPAAVSLQPGGVRTGGGVGWGLESITEYLCHQMG